MVSENILLADGTPVKIGMLVTNKPGALHCAYGGCYTEGRVGVLLKICSVNKVMLTWNKGMSTWTAYPSELITANFHDKSAKQWAKNAGVKKGSWVANKECCVVGKPIEPANYLGRIICFTSASTVSVETINHGYRFFTLGSLVVVETPEISISVSRRQGHRSKTCRCSNCFNSRKCYLSKGGWFCVRCYNQISRCHQCNKIQRYGDMLHGACLSCFISQISMYQPEAERNGLDASLWLAREAADFYLLYLYYVKTDNKKPLMKKTKQLANQFSRYMFMAIGGEARYAPYTAIMNNNDLMSTLYSSVKNKLLVRWFFSQICYDRLERDKMWTKWLNYSKNAGKKEMTKFAYSLFSLEHTWEGHSIGGRKWAGIAKTLLDYFNNDITDVMFVDTAFGLKHNGAIHFSKVWSLAYLQETLDNNLEGQYADLHEIASEKVKELTKCVI